MKVRFHLALATLYFGFVGYGISPAHADFYLHSWQNQWTDPKLLRLGIETKFYGTASNYDNTGNKSVPATLSLLTRLQTDINVNWGVFERLAVFGRMGLVNASLSGTTSSSQFGFADQTAGADLRVYTTRDAQIAVDVQSQVDFPGGYNNTAAAAAGLPFLGDGSVDWTSGVFMTYLLHRTTSANAVVVGGAGYTWRSGGYSSSITYSAMARFYPNDSGWLLDAGLAGAFSFGNDSRTNLSPQPSILGSGGSYFTNAINPTILSGIIAAGYRFTPSFNLLISASQSMLGNNAPQGTSIAAALQFLIGDPGTRRMGYGTSPNLPSASNRGFVSYSLTARAVKVNDRLNLVSIDKGLQDGVERGQIFDIFKVRPDGTEAEAVARAQVEDVRSGESALSIVEYFEETLIEEGFIVKRVLR